MKCVIVYKPEAAKSIRKLPQIRKEKIKKRIELLAENPLAGKVLKGKLKGIFSLRVWPYRILYEYHQQRIIIRNVLHRQSAYP